MIPSSLPPADGSVTVIPGFVDFHAEHNPNRAWAIFPSQTSPTGTSSLSFGEFARATHRVAHRVRPDRQGAEREVVGLIIHTDAILYMAVIAGLMRAGIIVSHRVLNAPPYMICTVLILYAFQPLPMSPKLSSEAIANLLKKTSAHRVITQDAFLPTLKALQIQLAGEEFNLVIEHLVPLDEVFPTLKGGAIVDDLPEGPYRKAEIEPDMDEVVMYSHSSGSTGFPKPVPLTRKIQLQWATSSEYSSIISVPHT